MIIDDPSSVVGQYFGDIVLETCTDPGISRPRVKPVKVFPPSTRVEFPRKLREMFPIGTRFRATVKVCQKHDAEGKPNGPAYLRAYDIATIAASVPDEGLMAKVRAGSISGISYEYSWRTKD
ncbi:hypothetical protein LNKW23_44580 [Paralimibaculum aggregatum]|uniref:Uncharacterized protein n=1 Tax=Paralimibaculum aggregatum TaxID=3036245 RepID=A0ABQ6LT45_9RHOB|nr:hypothetical protein [Limibaculum sp. NKW23]GMG85241.1 hypothetical protein LNKW23_44580 [Limibaculum sp. NKW23]